jgi:type II secretory pathway pseudopilin PulG
VVKLVREHQLRSADGRPRHHPFAVWGVHVTRFLAKASARLSRNEGFTLVELLVAMAAGMVVVGGLVTVLSVTLQQTTNTFTRVDATERARTMLARVEDELHSACLANGVTPIEGGAQGTKASDASNLVFVSQFGTSASPTPVEHKITFNSANGTLTEYTYNATTGGSDPTKWAFSSNPTNASGKLLLNHVAQVTIPGTPSPTVVPVFQYFAYEPYTDVNGNPAEMLLDGSAPVPGTTTLPNPDPLVVPLTSATTSAPSVAEVTINLVVGPQGGSFENTNLSGVDDPVTDSIVLRFTPPADAADAGVTFGPCA